LGVLLVAIMLGPSLSPAALEKAPPAMPGSDEAFGDQPADAGHAPGEPQAEPAEQVGEGAGSEGEERGVAPPAAPGEKGQEEARDPFRPFIVRQQQAEEQVPEAGPTAYELRQLTLVGVMLDLTPPRALLEDSSGMGFVVTPGTRVGRHGGVVAAIEPGRMIVEEKTLDFYGREQLTRQVLEIPQELEPKAVGRGRR